MSADLPGLVVIGAGVMRTGTMSLKAAFERLLDGPCYHMTTVFQNPHHVGFWNRMLSGEATDDEIRGFFKGYRAIVAFPGTVFYRRLCEVFPDAKVVLSVRDTHSWFLSVQNTLAQLLSLTGSFPLRYISLPFTQFSNIAVVRPFLIRLLSRFFGDDFVLEDEEKMARKFMEHSDEVKACIDAHRLLVFRAEDGWEPLCKHLGRPVPDVPYPNRNSSIERQTMFNKLRLFRSVIWATLIALGAIAIYTGKVMYERNT